MEASAWWIRETLSLFSEIPGHQLMLLTSVPSTGISGYVHCVILSSQHHQEVRTVIFPFTKEEMNQRDVKWRTHAPEVIQTVLPNQDSNPGPGPCDSRATDTASLWSTKPFLLKCCELRIWHILNRHKSKYKKILGGSVKIIYKNNFKIHQSPWKNRRR